MRKLFACILVSTILFSFCACAETKESIDDSETDTTTQITTEKAASEDIDYEALSEACHVCQDVNGMLLDEAERSLVFVEFCKKHAKDIWDVCERHFGADYWDMRPVVIMKDGSVWIDLNTQGDALRFGYEDFIDNVTITYANYPSEGKMVNITGKATGKIDNNRECPAHEGSWTYYLSIAEAEAVASAQRSSKLDIERITLNKCQNLAYAAQGFKNWRWTFDCMRVVSTDEGDFVQTRDGRELISVNDTNKLIKKLSKQELQETYEYLCEMRIDGYETVGDYLSK